MGKLEEVKMPFTKSTEEPNQSNNRGKSRVASNSLEKLHKPHYYR